MMVDIDDVVWPSAPIEFVSHGGVGSGPQLMLDALSRGFVEAGCPVAPAVVILAENEGVDAIRYVASSGSTSVVGSCTPTYLTTPLVHGMSESYDTLTPVAGLVADSYLLVVRHDNSAANAVELFDKPTRAGAPKRGGNTDIQAMLLRDAVATDIHVEYIHSQAETMVALASGTIDWTSGVFSDFERYLEDGSVRIVAVFDGEPTPQQQAPTLLEQGIAVTFPLWRGLMGCGAWSREALQMWDRSLHAAFRQPSWRAYLDRERQRQSHLTPARFTTLLNAENERYSKWVSLLEI